MIKWIVRWVGNLSTSLTHVALTYIALAFVVLVAIILALIPDPPDPDKALLEKYRECVALTDDNQGCEEIVYPDIVRKRQGWIDKIHQHRGKK